MSTIFYVDLFDLRSLWILIMTKGAQWNESRRPPSGRDVVNRIDDECTIKKWQSGPSGDRETAFYEAEAIGLRAHRRAQRAKDGGGTADGPTPGEALCVQRGGGDHDGRRRPQSVHHRLSAAATGRSSMHWICRVCNFRTHSLSNKFTAKMPWKMYIFSEFEKAQNHFVFKSDPKSSTIRVICDHDKMWSISDDLKVDRFTARCHWVCSILKADTLWTERGSGCLIFAVFILDHGPSQFRVCTLLLIIGSRALDRILSAEYNAIVLLLCFGAISLIQNIDCFLIIIIHRRIVSM